MLFLKPLKSHCGGSYHSHLCSLFNSSAPEFLAQACFQAASEARPRHLHPIGTGSLALYDPSSCRLSKMQMCVSSAWVKLQPVFLLLLLTTLQLWRLPPPVLPSVTNSAYLLSPGQPRASCCTVSLCFSRHWTVRCVMFFICFFMYQLYERFYKPITTQNYIAACVTGYLS